MKEIRHFQWNLVDNQHFLVPNNIYSLNKSFCYLVYTESSSQNGFGYSDSDQFMEGQGSRGMQRCGSP